MELIPAFRILQKHKWEMFAGCKNEQRRLRSPVRQMGAKTLSLLRYQELRRGGGSMIVVSKVILPKDNDSFFSPGSGSR